LTEAADKVTRAVVGARRLIGILEVQRVLAEPAQPADEPAVGVPLRDPASGLVVEPRLLTAVVSPAPQVASALADRLARFTDSDVLLGDVPLRDLPLSAVRRRILLADKSPVLFSGRLGEELGVDRRRVLAAVTTASADDVIDALPDGLDTDVGEGARAFSGGERQRLLLARAIAAAPEILVLDEPTSAVDAHTEARIAERLRTARAGHTTVLFTTSPLLLAHADVVVLLDGERVVATGRHDALLRTSPAYAALVLRGETDAAAS
jgi:ABC-type multidrug transport system fused ATPase/permease subunit